jgi:phosphoglucosamine mutase
MEPRSSTISGRAGTDIGKAVRIDDARGRYVTHVKYAFPRVQARRLKIVVDCAHGAAYKVAPLVLPSSGPT